MVLGDCLFWELRKLAIGRLAVEDESHQSLEGPQGF